MNSGLLKVKGDDVNDSMEEQKNWQLIRLTIRKPLEAFTYIKERPKIWTPLIIRFAGLILLTVLMSPLVSRQSMEQLQTGGANIPPAQIEQIKVFMESPIFTLIGLVSAVISLLAVWLLMSLVFYFFGSIWGEKREFKVSLSMVAFSWIPLALHDFLASAVVILSGQPIRPGLSALLPAETAIQPTFLSTFLKYVDIFSIWSLVLLIIGLSIVFKLNKRKSVLIVLGYMALTVLVNGGLASLSSLAR